MVRTVRRVAAGFVTYVGRVTGSGSHRVPSATAGITDVSAEAATSSKPWRLRTTAYSSGTSSSAAATGSSASAAAGAAGATRPRRSDFTITRHRTSQATTRPAGTPCQAHATYPRNAT